MSRARRPRQRTGRRHRPASRSSDAPAPAPSYAHPLGRAMAELLEPLLGGPRPAADRRACWSPFVLACSAVLVAWESARTLGERLAAACQTLDAMIPGVRLGGATYQGWAKALAREGTCRAAWPTASAR